jgi:GNAT superfamily N-acetyltransferase
MQRGVQAVEDLPPELVYIGFSLGVVPAQQLAQTRPGTRGAVLCYACIPVSEFGSAWPDGVPVQVHGMDHDPIFIGEGDVDAARALVERHDGVWGGWWRLSFHAEGVGRDRTPEQNRLDKEARVRDGRTHAALVYDGFTCVGWCQFGPTDELPRIKRKRMYEGEAGEPPDWRITCFFVDRRHGRQGVAAAALAVALRENARLGGGTVESLPEDADGRSVSGSFLHNATVSMFEHHGFTRVRPLGKHHWLVVTTVPST